MNEGKKGLNCQSDDRRHGVDCVRLAKTFSKRKLIKDDTVALQVAKSLLLRFAVSNELWVN